MPGVAKELWLSDDLGRADPRPPRHDEPQFAFLNRVRSPYWEGVRALLEAWFQDLPPEIQADVRGRFRSPDDRHHVGALWELFIHESLRVDAFTLTPHPEISGIDRRPDFLAQRGEFTFYVEATVSSTSNEEAASARRVGRLNEELNKVRSPNFSLLVQIYEEGGADPPVRRLRHRLEGWLAGLDPDLVADELRSAPGRTADAMPRYRWHQDGWDIGFRANPIRPEHRGRPGHRPVGATGPGRASFVDAITPLRATLEDKATRYGKLDRPYLIAVLCEAEMITDDFDIEGALFGQEAVSVNPDTLEARRFRQPDGFWTGRAGVRSGVSGVLTARSIRPWTVAQVEPRLWFNPWAEHPIPDALPWGSVRVDVATGSVIRAEPDRSAHERFGLNVDWPGPGVPFPYDL